MLPPRPDGKPFEAVVRSYDNDPELHEIGPAGVRRRAAHDTVREAGAG
jgi:hypothetical protein